MLLFREFARINARRAARWHTDAPWSPSEWITALTGELGEAAEVLDQMPEADQILADPDLRRLTAAVGKAANIIKKLNRHAQGLAGNKPKDRDPDKLRAELHEELADVATYLFCLADAVDCDLEAEIITKFNAVSARTGLPDQLDNGVSRTIALRNFVESRHAFRNGDPSRQHSMDAEAFNIAADLARALDITPLAQENTTDGS